MVRGTRSTNRNAAVQQLGADRTSSPARMTRFLSFLAICMAVAGQVSAHATDQAFVLLLPTDVYSATGAGIVLLTIVLLLILPNRVSSRFFRTVPLPGIRLPGILPDIVSVMSTILLAFLILQGMTGTRDPLTNLMPVTIWTIWWIGLFLVQGLFGDIWRWVNPWTGFHKLVSNAVGIHHPSRLPDWLGCWPAVAIYVCYVAFLLADPAPDDPSRLATLVGCYWLFTMIGMIVFGRKAWLEQCECFTILFRYLACLAAWRNQGEGGRLGLPGWQLVEHPALSASQALFVLTVLACSSFDGLNETFWWLDTIGVNPLEFPGRSAVITETVMGILGGILLLATVFNFTVIAGDWLDRRFPGDTAHAAPSAPWGLLVLSLLPIAFGYHFAHFIPTLLVSWQYALVAISDPLSTGADWLGLGRHFVTTGFFAELGTVRIIWLTQCAAIVLGHVLAVLVGHRVLAGVYGGGWRSIIAEIPLSVLMILYTLLSLWLLASPRGA